MILNVFFMVFFSEFETLGARHINQWGGNLSQMILSR